MAKKKKRLSQLERMLIVSLGFFLVLALCLFLIKSCLGLFIKKETPANTVKEEKTIEKTETQENTKEASLSDDQKERLSEYMDANPDVSKEDAINYILMNLDLEPYSSITEVDDDSDITYLINKYYALPEGYEPDDLVYVENPCKQDGTYGCTTDGIQVRKEAAEAFDEFCAAAKEQGIDMIAISGFRDYAYQQMLWENAANTQGQEYADQYFARPGQSEHNTGLAIDLTVTGVDFNQLETYENYDWILENAHKYGFILRYPEDKVDITKYEYESWHFRYVGKKVAKICYDNDWTLEEYTVNK